MTSLTTALKSDDPLTRDSAVDDVLKNRDTQIRELLALVTFEDNRDDINSTRCVAVFLLGELRATEAIPTLSKLLTVQVGPIATTDKSRYDVPVFRALVKIGRPAIPAMISNVEQSDDLLLRKRSLDVMLHVLGGKQQLLDLLLKLNNRTSDREVSRRLREAHSWSEVHYKYKIGEEPLY